VYFGGSAVRENWYDPSGPMKTNIDGEIPE
jgi:hypothetical protein